MILTTIENSAQSLITHTTESLAQSLGHKYGGEMAGAVRTIGSTARNVGVVYVDYHGVGRRVLIKKMGKRVIKGKMGKKDVVFGADAGSVARSNVPEKDIIPVTGDPGPSSRRWQYEGEAQVGDVPGGYSVSNVPYKS